MYFRTPLIHGWECQGKINKQRLGTKAVDLKTFQKTIKAYEGEETFVIKSSAGKKAFAFDTADISGQIGHVFSTLTKGFNTVLLDGKDASIKDFKKIQTRMKEYRFYQMMDKRDKTTYPRVIIDLIWRGKVKQDGGKLDYFLGYTEAQVAKKMKQLHDIELDGAALGLPSPKKPSPIELLHYEKGVFYMPPTDHYGDHVVRDVTAAKKIANQTYFVTFRDTFFNAMEYYDVTEDATFDLNKYKNKPLSEWPEKTKAFLKTGIPSYAVVKFVNGTMQLHYMGYLNLTEAELKSF
ncbi:hypothetical protein [Lysinibacillus sp. LZ02]|uniref:hypothetical protein n=1 Tax=Lysinibacillus sp. LZ02 TaxID=3420668 RepID=UPI003D36EFF4